MLTAAHRAMEVAVNAVFTFSILQLRGHGKTEFMPAMISALSI
jgi:hypothetical protein